MTTTTTEATTVTEWGVKLTWDDGYTEVRRESARDDAERSARMHNSVAGEEGRPSAEVVTHTVTTSGWVVAS